MLLFPKNSIILNKPAFMNKRWLFLFLLLLGLQINEANSVYAQKNEYQLLKFFPVQKGKFINTDDLGNVYIGTTQGNLIKLNNEGDSVSSFNKVSYGQLKNVDASNPLKILLFYEQYGKIIILDKMMSIKAELDLRRMGYSNVTAAGISADGNIWIYNETDAELIKVNEQQQVILKSNDLRQETLTVPQPSILLEKEGLVYLCDENQGIYILNRQGRFIQLLPFEQVENIQIIDRQMVLFLNKKFVLYNQKTFKEQEIPLPSVESSIIDVRIERGRLFVLTDKALDIFYTLN